MTSGRLAGYRIRPVFDNARAVLAQRGEPDPDLALIKLLWDAQSEAMRMHYQEGKAREAVDLWYRIEARRILTDAGLIQ